MRNRIYEVRKHYEKLLSEIKKLDNKKFQLVCIFTLFDSMSQEYSNYSKGKESDKFTNFVEKFKSPGKWDVLTEVDPITLYYDVEDIISGEIDLERCVAYGFSSSITSVCKLGITDWIRSELLKSGWKENEIQIIMKKHRYVYLIYKMRSKLMHEFALPGSEYLEPLEKHDAMPFYMTNLRFYSVGGKSVSDSILELSIPLDLLKSYSLIV